MNRCLLCLFLLLVAAQGYAQQEGSSIKFSEEKNFQLTDKNVKWVPKRAKSYNLDSIKSLVKFGFDQVITIPNLNKYRFPPVAFNLGYERKLLNSPFSLELNLNASAANRGYGLRHLYGYEFNYSSNLSKSSSIINYASLDFIARYYFLQSKAIRKGRGGNNLYGIYLFGQISDFVAWSEKRTNLSLIEGQRNVPIRLTKSTGFNVETVQVGFGIGYQQRVFKRAFIDARIGVKGYAVNDTWRGSYDSHLIEFNFGYSIFKKKK